jgi:SfnB family sulfur acquisition oxidoreductase
MSPLEQVVGLVPVLDATTALAEADRFGVMLAEGASRRDVERELPREELRALAASGLLAVTVPTEFGGAGLSVEVLAEIIRRISWGDPNVGQIPQSHFAYVNALRLAAEPAQQAFFFDQVLRGAFFGNAQSEIGTKHIRDIRTTLLPAGDGSGDWVLDGVKGYATGALYADWIPTLAHLGADGPLHVAWVRADDPGVEVVDDWDGLGQRTTASGTVRLTRVRVPVDRVTGHHENFDGRPQTYGSFAQTLHAAIDAGIARAALDEAASFVGSFSRPHPDAGVERHSEDPLVVQTFGELELAVRSAEALLVVAARAVDAANADLTAESAGAASLALAAARVATSRAAVDASSRLFEVSGTRSALARLNLDRHWRNARTHTLHDPAAWKVQHLGRWAVSGTLPPSHGQI